jgi:hypothetical protein
MLSTVLCFVRGPFQQYLILIFLFIIPSHIGQNKEKIMKVITRLNWLERIFKPRSENKNCPIWKNWSGELRPPFENTRNMRPKQNTRPKESVQNLIQLTLLKFVQNLIPFPSIKTLRFFAFSQLTVSQLLFRVLIYL